MGRLSSRGERVVSNLITWVLKSGEPSRLSSERDVTIEKRSERCNFAGLEDGGRGPHIKECKEMDSLLEFPERNEGLLSP